MRQLDNLLANLESLLVKEFRAYQRILNLKREESQALSNFDIEALGQLSDHVEIIYDEIDQMQNQRRVVSAKIADQLHMDNPSPTLNQLSTALDHEASDRIHRLQEGTAAIKNQIRQLTNRNTAITPLTLKRPKSLDSL
jgi:hypothetical protein